MSPRAVVKGRDLDEDERRNKKRDLIKVGLLALEEGG
jgi:hypothetical protein